MKLIQYERPGLAWPVFGRLSNLQDELDRLFEAPLTGWAPALDVREDKDGFIVRIELPGLKREDIEVSLARWRPCHFRRTQVREIGRRRRSAPPGALPWKISARVDAADTGGR